MIAFPILAAVAYLVVGDWPDASIALALLVAIVGVHP